MLERRLHLPLANRRPSSGPAQHFGGVGEPGSAEFRGCPQLADLPLVLDQPDLGQAGPEPLLVAGICHCDRGVDLRIGAAQHEVPVIRPQPVEDRVEIGARGAGDAQPPGDVGELRARSHPQLAVRPAEPETVIAAARRRLQIQRRLVLPAGRLQDQHPAGGLISGQPYVIAFGPERVVRVTRAQPRLACREDQPGAGPPRRQRGTALGEQIGGRGGEHARRLGGLGPALPHVFG